MDSKRVLSLVLLAAAASVLTSQDSFPKDKDYFQESGTLTEMQAVPCGSRAKGFTGIGGLLATAGIENVNSKDKLCQEYVLRTNYIEYRIRPVNDKDAALLPVGEKSQFRIVKGHILLNVPEGDGKTREYLVVGMKPLKPDEDYQSTPAAGPVQLQRRTDPNPAQDSAKPADSDPADPAASRVQPIRYSQPDPQPPGGAYSRPVAVLPTSTDSSVATVPRPLAATPEAPQSESSASANKPLTAAQVMGLVAGGVASARVAALVRNRGISFQPTSDFLTDLKSVGASEELLNAVAHANVPGDAAAATTTPNAQRSPASPNNATQARGLQATERQDRAAELARPDDPSVHLELADALGQEGKWSEAAAQYAAVISNDPNNAAVHNDLALALRKSGDIEGAIREYQRALAINPSQAAIHDNLGVALSQKGDAQGAIAQFREAIRNDPRSAQAHNNLGSMLEQQRDLDGAIREYQQAIDLGGTGDVQYNLGSALDLKGELNGAISSFRQVLKTNPDDVRTRCALGGALERKGDLQGAFHEYDIARQLAPNDATVQANYNRLAKSSSAHNTTGSGT